MRFIGGNDIPSLFKTVNKLLTRNFIPIIDYAKEASRSPSDVIHYIAQTRKLLDSSQMQQVPHPTQLAFAVKLSSYMQYHPYKHITEFIERIDAQANNTRYIFLDAEQSELKTEEDYIYNRVIKDSKSLKRTHIFKTYQMYRRDCLRNIIQDVSQFNNFGLKLVRGAYHSVHDPVLFQTKEETDESYNHAVEYLCKHVIPHRPDIKVCFATHNDHSINLAVERASIKKNISFAQLLDMRDDLGEHTLAHKYTTFKYVPYGDYIETLPYLIRRLHENKYMLKHIIHL